jgi:RND family efflux transporter MFP subunit
MKIEVFLVVGLLVLLLPAGCGSGEAQVEDVETFEVRRGDLDLKLVETGGLEARNKVDIRPETKAQIIKIVDEGAIVKKGDVLVELDDEPVKAEIEKLEASVTRLKAELKSAETDLEIQKGENASNLDKAEMNKLFAEKELERYLQGDYGQQQRDHELRITQAESRLDQAKDKYEKMPELEAKGFATRLEVEEKRLAVETAQTELESAKLALALFEKYTHPMNLQRKRSDVTEAQRELERVKARAEARLEARAAVVQQKRLEYDRAVEQLEEAKKTFDTLTITAPQDGIVIYGGRRNRWGGREDEPAVGEMAFPGRTLIELPDLSKMDVVIRVHQADINKLRIGQRAWVSLPQRGSKRYEAKVAEIGSVAQSGGWRDQVKRFDVRVQITDKVEGLRAGVTVEVQVDLGKLENVLHVPLQCTSASGGGYAVYVKEGAEVKRKRVRLGKASDQFVEVVEGLTEGERVLLVNPEVVTEEEEEEKPENGGRPSPRQRPNGRTPGGGRGAGGSR